MMCNFKCEQCSYKVEPVDFNVTVKPKICLIIHGQDRILFFSKFYARNTAMVWKLRLIVCLQMANELYAKYKCYYSQRKFWAEV